MMGMRARLQIGLWVFLAMATWAQWAPVRNVSDGRGEAVEEAGRRALRITTTGVKSKCFLWSEFVPASCGSKWTLRFQAKSATAKRQDARAGVIFCDASGKRIVRPGDTVLRQCGGGAEWRGYELTFTVPEWAAGFRATVCVYQAAGQASFAEVALADAAGKVTALPPELTPPPPPRKAPAPKKPTAAQEGPVPAGTIWSYRFEAGGKSHRFHLTGLELGAELAHYDGPDSLRFLTGTGSAVSDEAAPYTLNSSSGSSYWLVFNLTSLAQSLVWSRERIPMVGDGATSRFAVPFTRRRTDYFDGLTKGPYALRGHRYFAVFGTDGRQLGVAQRQLFQAQLSPEANFFGDGRSGAGARQRAWLFTLADLSGAFTVDVADFRSSGKGGGDFAFRLVVRDAKGEEHPVNRVAKLTVLGDGKPLEAEMRFGQWNIPTGWYVGRYGAVLPQRLSIRAELRASTSAGVKPVTATAEFSAAATAAPPPALEAKPAPCVKAGERRDVCIPLGAFKGEEAAGKAEALEALRRLKAANCTGVYVFALGNRGQKAGAKISASTLTTLYSWDYLGFMREATKAAGLEMFGIVCLLPEGAEKLRGILAEHPEWAMRDAGGKALGWMDPAVPEVRAYRVKSIVEAAKAYRLDGVELDYARLAKRPSDRGAEIYRAQFGVDPRTFAVDTPEYRRWYAWESAQLTQMVREVREAMRRECPGVRLSAYVQGVKYAGDGLWSEGHQPFGDWLEEGVLDSISPTGYIYDMLQYRSWVKRQIDYCHARNPKVPVHITIGTGSSHGRLESLDELVFQIDEANRLGGDGAHFFQWNSFRYFCEGLGKTRYAAPAK